MTSKNAALPIILCVILLFTVESALAQFWTATTAPRAYWASIASSADGSRLVAAQAAVIGSEPAGGGGFIYLSADSGDTWTQGSAPFTNWAAVASSADGANLIAAVGDFGTSHGETWHRNGLIYISRDFGATWNPSSAPVTRWTCVACSANGTNVVAASRFGSVYLSTNSGRDWLPANAPSDYWQSVACSRDGSFIAVASSGWSSGLIFISTNYGNSWLKTTAPTNNWLSLACSADGAKVFAGAGFSYAVAGNYSPVYVSTNFGSTWQPSTSRTSIWESVTCSADGAKLAGLNAPIFTSSDSGLTWVRNFAPYDYWGQIACSADGNKMAATVSYQGLIYVLKSGPSLRIARSDTNVVISWPSYVTGFGLQECADAGTSSWADVLEQPTVTNVENQVSVPGTQTQRFYRLRGP
jgi:hypothetical protein